MNIYVIGGGAIGLLVSFYLKQEHHEVTICTRTKAQADLLNEKGLTLIRNEYSETQRVKSVQLDEAAMDAADVCIFAVKSYDLKQVMKKVLSKRRTNLSYLFLQNGMTHVEIAKQLEEGTIAFATVSHGAVRLEHTTIHHTGIGALNWALYQKQSDTLPDWLHSIQSDFFQVNEQGSWEELLWSKLLVNVCINPITALSGLKNGELLKSEELNQLMRSVFEEAMHLHPLLPDKERAWNHVLTVCKQTEQNTSSMLVDIKKERQTEVDAILGYLLRLAKHNGLVLPTIYFLHQALLNREQVYRLNER